MRRIRPSRADDPHACMVVKYGYHALYRMDGHYHATRHNAVVGTFSRDDYLVLAEDPGWSSPAWTRADNVAICTPNYVVPADDALALGRDPREHISVLAISTCMTARTRRRLGTNDRARLYAWIGTPKNTTQTCVDLTGHVPRNVHMLVGRRFQESISRIAYVYRPRTCVHRRRQRLRTGAWVLNRARGDGFEFRHITRMFSWRHPYDIAVDASMFVLTIDQQVYEITGVYMQSAEIGHRARVRGWVMNPDTVRHRYDCDK